MLKILFVLFILVFNSSSALAELRSGDIIFHTSKSSQSRAVQLAMNSPYSHMGLILYKKGKPFVFEASKTVRYTPLKEWIQRGVDGKYVVKRLKNEALLNPEKLSELFRVAATFEGKPYDLYFEWSDERIYCSELVWKIYSKVLGLGIGKTNTFREFDLSHPHVKAKLKERYGDTLPLEEKVISPVAMFDSPLLVSVKGN